MRTVVAALLAMIVLAPPAVFGGPDDERVQPGAKVGELGIDSSVEGERDKDAPSPFGPFLELVGGVLIVAVAGGLIVFFYRRFAGGAIGLRGSRVVEVLGRTALSPRHAVCLLKVGRRLVLVGVAGDRVAPISVIESADEVAEILQRVDGDGSAADAEPAGTAPETTGGERC